jgi:predicted transcriptional regulator
MAIAFLTKTRWNILRLMRVEGERHPRPVSLELVQQELELTQRDASVSLNGMIVHGILVRVGSEYRVTKLGARLLVDTDTMSINEVTFELPS